MDPLSAVGLAASIIQFIEIGVKIVDRLSAFGSNASQIPASFRQVRIELPLVIDGLRRIHDQVVAGSLDPSTEKSLVPVIHECQQTAKELDDLLEKTIPSAGASSWERKKMALISLGRDKHVEQLATSIAGFVRVLTFHQVIGSSQQAADQKVRPDDSAKKTKNWVLLPFDRNSTFVGRQGILRHINELFKVKPGSQPKAALYGLGGIGKSQIALEYCYRRLETDNNLSLFWINAATATGFEESFNRIASQCELISRDDSSTDRVLLVKDWLQTRHLSPWLMVVDNVDNQASYFRDKIRNGKTPSQCVPHCAHGSLLFTTRSSDMAVDLANPAEAIPILRLSKEEGIQLVRERLPGKVIPDDQVLALLEELEYIPIAITQAVAFISKRRLKSLAQYLEQYRKNDSTRTRMLTYEFTEHGRHHGSLESVAKTWSLSFEGIRGSNPRAADLLCKISFFQHQSIPRLLIRSPSPSEDEEEGFDEDLEEAIAILRAYSFLDASEDETTYNTHHLVQLASQWWLRTQLSPNELEKWVSVALQTIADVFPQPINNPAPEYFSLCQSLLPHAEPLLNYDFKAVTSAPSLSGSVSQREIDLARANLLASTGKYLHWQGFYTQGLARVQESFLLRKSHLGEANPLTLQSMGLLFWSLTFHQTFTSATEPEDLNLDSILGGGHGYSMGTARKSRLNKSYMRRIRLILLGRKLVKLRTDVLGADDPDTIDAMSDLAAALERCGRFAESAKLQAEAVEKSTNVLGARHNDTLNCVCHLASVLEEMGQMEEAINLQRRVYELKCQTLGNEHPDVLTQGSNYAQMLVRLGGGGRVFSKSDSGSGVEGLTEQSGGASWVKQVGGHSSTKAESKSPREEGIQLMARMYELKRKTLGVDHRATLVSADALIYYYAKESENWPKALELADQVVTEMETGPRSGFRQDNNSLLGSIKDWRFAVGVWLHYGRNGRLTGSFWDEKDEDDADLQEDVEMTDA
ncbi:short-chain dehydrogenase [Rhypophila decipiens]